MTDEGNINRYLGVEVKNQSDGSLEPIKEYLIGRIIKAVGLEPSSTGPKSTLVSARLLHKDQESLPRKKDWTIDFWFECCHIFRGWLGQSYLWILNNV